MVELFVLSTLYKHMVECLMSEDVAALPLPKGLEGNLISNFSWAQLILCTIIVMGSYLSLVMVLM